VHGLPQANFDLLKRIAEHLDRSVSACFFRQLKDTDATTPE
jgi:hypothetical protein